MRVREHSTFGAANQDRGDDEVVVVLRGKGLPDRFGVMPAQVSIEAVEGRVRSQPIDEFLRGYWGAVETEARRLREVGALTPEVGA